MQTICPGRWTAQSHQAEILMADDQVTDGKKSHGMCAACAKAVEAEFLKETK